MRIYVHEHLSASSCEQVMSRMGVDPAGIRIMREKGSYLSVHVRDISSVAANILKQEMLSRGGEVAIPRGALYGSKKGTSVLMFGTRRQFTDLIPKLTIQPFGLKELAAGLTQQLENTDRPVQKVLFGQRMFNLSKRSLCMGILNVTPDSLSDGGRYCSPETAFAHAEHMLKDGADIIDLGAESTRPGAREVKSAEELKRLLPVVKTLRARTKCIISIDTTKASVAEACLKAGAHMINDVSGLTADKKLAKVISKYKAPVVIMHRSGKSSVMQKRTKYTDIVFDIIDSLQKSIDIAVAAGIDRTKIIIDPGIGFGKTTEQNLEIFKRLSEFKCFGLPILIGASRKSVIGNVLGLDVNDRMEGTLALTAAAIQGGASIVRVHDVKENLRVMRMCDAIQNIPSL